jgi:hypothetical protein
MTDGSFDRPKGYTQHGFEDRFRVSRVDGQPINPKARYLVLDYSGRDPHAVVAIKAYADSIEAENPAMAADLRAALARPADFPSQHVDAA